MAQQQQAYSAHDGKKDRKGTIMAVYSTNEKAQKVMEMICNVYPEFEKANIVFRFPKDDEV